MKTPLSYQWAFVEGFEQEFLNKIPSNAIYVDLPHGIKLLPYHGFSFDDCSGVYTYIKSFSVKKKEGRSYFLDFEGAMVQFDLYLNGVDLGHFVSGYLPVEIDATDALKDGKNEVLVKLSTKEDPTIPPFGTLLDSCSFGGLYRPVYLIDRPKAGQIKDVYAYGTKDGTIHLSYESEEPVEASLYLEEDLLLAFKGKEAKVIHPRIWTIEDPFVYRLVLNNGFETVELPFAFKDEEAGENALFVQGKRCPLLGMTLDLSYPYMGKAVSPSLSRKDARLLKEIGINLVKVSYYAPDDAFLEECDRLGLYVINEIPKGGNAFKDPLWKERYLEFYKTMVKKERQHPCVLSFDADEETRGILKELDPYRSNLGNILLSQRKALGDVKPTDRLFLHEDRILAHIKALGALKGNPDAAGTILGPAFDYVSKNGDEDGISYLGVYDFFREKKPSAYVYASQREDPVMEVIDPYSLRPLILSNADFIEVYKDEVKVTTLYPREEDDPNLRHPPFLWDKPVNLNFYEEGLSPSEGRFLVECINSCIFKGFESLPFFKRLELNFFLKKHEFSFSYFEGLVRKYGSLDSCLMFKGYKDGKVMGTRTYKKQALSSFDVRSDSHILKNEDTYDSTRIVIQKIDEFGNKVHYADDELLFETEGPIALLSPKVVHLLGGSIGVYVRSLRTRKKEEAKLLIHHRGGRMEVLFEVETKE